MISDKATEPKNLIKREVPVAIEIPPEMVRRLVQGTRLNVLTNRHDSSQTMGVQEGTNQ